MTILLTYQGTHPRPILCLLLIGICRPSDWRSNSLSIDTFKRYLKISRFETAEPIHGRNAVFRPSFKSVKSSDFPSHSFDDRCHQIAPSCTDLHLCLHKFSGGETNNQMHQHRFAPLFSKVFRADSPDPHNWGRRATPSPGPSRRRSINLLCTVRCIVYSVHGR